MRRMLLMVGALAVVAVSAALVSGASGVAGSRLTGDACSARWRVVATGVKVPLLSAVAAISPTDVWAVGGSDNLEGKATPVIVHWDGKRLRSYSAFKPSRRNGSYLTAISAVASDDVWAVGVDGGKRVVMHWDGRAWKRVTTPRVRGNGGLNGIAAISSSDVWAVGSDDNGALVMHWNGRAWSLTSLRGLVGSNTWLSEVAGASSHDIWAVGGRNIDLDSWAPVSLHWDGRSWKHVGAFDNDPAAGPVTGHMDGSSFNAVDVSSRSAVWTLGFQWGAQKTPTSFGGTVESSTSPTTTRRATCPLSQPSRPPMSGPLARSTSMIPKKGTSPAWLHRWSCTGTARLGGYSTPRSNGSRPQT